jgi:large subunit ribosomal protein L5
MVEKDKDKAAKQKAANKARAAAKKNEVEHLATGTIEKSKEPPRLQTAYSKTIVAELMKDLKKSNKHQVPKLEKIVINMGVNEAKENIQSLDVAREELAAITGQRPQIRRAKKSISNFKLREGMPIGVRVTLRGVRMFEFLDRLVMTAVPRIRDFRGLNAGAFDGQGNFNLGLKEHHIFAEINLEKSPKARGMNITFVTTATNDDDGRALLTRLGVPFKKKDKE